jgi:cytochrome c oxidase subunit III
MPTIEAPTQPPRSLGGNSLGGDGAGFLGFGGPGGNGGRSGEWSVPAHTYQTGMWMALAAIVMLFAAFTSAMVVRKGLSDDWVATELPHLLYFNTLILIASSVTLEMSRHSLKKDHRENFGLWLYATLILGIAFVGGQLMAWRELAERGVYLSTNPSSSFFYLLTATHGIHLLGGIIALAYVALKARNIASGQKKRTALDVTALYWHFMDGLWVYILILFLVRL